MVECTSIEYNFHKSPNMYPNLNANISNDKKFRLNKINEIKDFSNAEIRERELMSKNLSKYIASFDYLINHLLFYLQRQAAFLLHHLQLLLELLLEL